MDKKFKLIVSALLFVATIHAQEVPMNYAKVDSNTYGLFLKQDWTQLLKVGKNYIKNNESFYYLNVRMGVAYFKEGKMLQAVKFLEKAYDSNNFDVVVQDYLYWAYRYSGMYLESDIFYKKMDASLQNKIKFKLPIISDIDVGLVGTSTLDYNEILSGDTNLNDEYSARYLSENYQLFMLGLNHRFSNNTNFYHRLTVMPRNLLQQENALGEVINTSYKGKETRYYGDFTFALGKRWYLDAYTVLLFGESDDLTSEGNKISYSDFVIGGSIAKSSFLFRNSFNMSYSNLSGYNQFQMGYSVSLYPLRNTLLVPFASVQYQNESLDSYNENNMVYTGGITVNPKNISITGYINTGEIHNFISNNASVVYNQTAVAKNEYGLILQLHLKKVSFKIGYSFMNMEDVNYTENNGDVLYKFNQQNIISGLTWRL